MSTEVQLDFAMMALKGRRYEEAEKIYSALATQNNSAEAWLGLGITKLYQIANGRSMDEAVFCFCKAISIDSSKTHAVQDQLILHSQIVLQAYGKVVDGALARHDATQKKAGLALLVTAASAVVGANSNSAYGTIASLGATGVGVGVAVDAFSEMKDLQTLVQSILPKCDEIVNGVKTNVDNDRLEYREFEGFVNALLDQIRFALNPKLRKTAARLGSNSDRKIGSANQSASTVPIQETHNFNHALHITLSILTGGAWLVVYGILYSRYRK